MAYPFLGVTLRVPSCRSACGQLSTLASWNDSAPSLGRGGLTGAQSMAPGPEVSPAWPSVRPSYLSPFS